MEAGDGSPWSEPPVPADLGAAVPLDVLLERFADTFGLHVFAGEIVRGEYFETYVGPGLEALLGGPLPDGADSGEAWSACVHEADRAAYRRAMEAIHGGGAAQVDYRLLGFDGVLRWVRECGHAWRRDGRLFVDGIAIDVSEAYAARAEADRRGAQLDQLVEALDEHVFAIAYRSDGTATRLFSGPGAERFVGEVAAPGRLGATWSACVHPDDRASFDDVARRRAVGEAASITYRLVGRDGETRWVSERVRLRCVDADVGTVFDAIVADVTEQVDARERLDATLRALASSRADAERRATTDALTGLLNRVALEAEVRRRLNDEAIGGLALMLIDVDRFKDANDHLGHDAGDRVLCAVADRLVKAVGARGVVGRWGGDEFAVVASVESRQGARALARRLTRRVGADAVPVVGGSIVPTISVGAAISEPETPLDVLAQAADGALYVAKDAGRNQAYLAGDAAPTTRGRPTSRGADALMVAAAARERVTSLHNEIVADLAYRIAVQLALPVSTRNACRLAGLLHDVGKVMLPDVLLTADGPLSHPMRDERWRPMPRSARRWCSTHRGSTPRTSASCTTTRRGTAPAIRTACAARRSRSKRVSSRRPTPLAPSRAIASTDVHATGALRFASSGAPPARHRS